MMPVVLVVLMVLVLLVLLLVPAQGADICGSIRLSKPRPGSGGPPIWTSSIFNAVGEERAGVGPRMLQAH